MVLSILFCDPAPVPLIVKALPVTEEVSAGVPPILTAYNSAVEVALKLTLAA